MKSIRWAWYGFSIAVLGLFLIQAISPYLIEFSPAWPMTWFLFQLGLFILLGLIWFRVWRKIPSKKTTTTQAAQNSETSETIEQMIGPLVHEINRPLSRLDQRLRDVELPDSARKDFDEVQDTVDLIRRVFEGKPNREWFQTVRLIKSLVEQFDGSKTIRFELGFEWMAGDFSGLRLAVKNLLKNSLEARDSEDLPIEISFLREGPEIVIKVADHSGGMNPDQVRKISSGKPLDQSGGMGLGLYLVRRIVKAHRGRFSVRSDSDVGTTVTLILPLPGSTS